MPADIDALWNQFWDKPDDAQLLRVYADALEAAGDPRGKLIQLSLLGDARTPEQEAAREALIAKKGAVAGPAKAWLREYEFGADGLLEKGRTEVGKLIEGIDALGRVHPRFVLTVTSIKTLKDAQALGAVSPAALGRIWMIDFGMISGSFGGNPLNDKQIAAIAPAFAAVTHLQLTCRGTPQKCFSPDGLRAFAKHAKALRFLAISFYSEGLAPIADYGRAIREGFANLRGVEFTDMTPADLAMPGVKLNTFRDINFNDRDGLAGKLVAAGLG